MLKKVIVSMSLSTSFVTHGMTRGLTDNEITVGTHTSLSGPAAMWGVSSVNAMKLYFDQINATGGIYGRKIKLVVEDHQYQIPKAIQAANKLLNRDKIFAMIAALGTPMNNAVFRQQFSKNVPNLFPYSSARSMSEPYHQLKVGGFSSYYHQARKGVKYFVKQKKKSKVCVMFQDSDYGEEIEIAVQDELKQQELNVTAITAHKPTDISFDVSLGKLRNKGCEVIVLGTIVKDTIQIMATAKKMRWPVDFLGTLASYDLIVSKAHNKVTENLYVTSPFVAQDVETGTKEAKRFIKAYTKRYQSDAGVGAQLAYVYAEIFAEGLKKAGPKLSVENLMKSIQSFSNLKISYQEQPINVDPRRDFFADPAYLLQVKNKTWKSLQTL